MSEVIFHRCINYRAKNVKNDSNNSCTQWFQIIRAPNDFKQFAREIIRGRELLKISLAGARIIRIQGVREIIRGRTVFESLGYMEGSVYSGTQHRFWSHLLLITLITSKSWQTGCNNCNFSLHNSGHFSQNLLF